jgi:hypothetical protein
MTGLNPNIAYLCSLLKSLNASTYNKHKILDLICADFRARHYEFTQMMTTTLTSTENEMNRLESPKLILIKERYYHKFCCQIWTLPSSLRN